MRPACILPGGDEREVANPLRVVLLEHVVCDRLELVFVHPRLRRTDGFHDAEPGDARRLAEQRDLARALDQAHGVDDGIEILDGGGRDLLLHAIDERRFTRQPAVPRILQRLACVVRGVGRRGCSERLRPVRKVDCPSSGADLFERHPELVAGKDSGDPAQLLGFGPRRQDRTFGSLGSFVAGVEEQRGRLGASVDDEDRPRNRDPGQVKELIVLTELDVRRILGRSLNDDGAVADLFHDLRPARGEFLGRQGVGEERRLRRSGGREGQNGKQQRQMACHTIELYEERRQADRFALAVLTPGNLHHLSQVSSPRRRPREAGFQAKPPSEAEPLGSEAQPR